LIDEQCKGRLHEGRISGKMERTYSGQVGLLQVEHDATTHERRRQVALVVAGDDDQRDATPAGDAAARVGDLEAQAAEYLEKIVRQVGVRLVDLVDQDHRRRQRRRLATTLGAERSWILRRALVERL